MIKVETFYDVEMSLSEACEETAKKMESWLNDNIERNNIIKIIAITESIGDCTSSRTVVAEVENNLFF